MNPLPELSSRSIRSQTIISAIIADSSLSHAGARMAVSLVQMADNDGQAKGRTAVLAAACRVAQRRVKPHLNRLADAGYFTIIDASRRGLFHVEIAPACIERVRFDAALDVSLTEDLPHE